MDVKFVLSNFTHLIEGKIYVSDNFSVLSLKLPSHCGNEKKFLANKKLGIVRKAIPH